MEYRVTHHPEEQYYRCNGVLMNRAGCNFLYGCPYTLSTIGMSIDGTLGGENFAIIANNVLYYQGNLDELLQIHIDACKAVGQPMTVKSLKPIQQFYDAFPKFSLDKYLKVLVAASKYEQQSHKS